MPFWLSWFALIASLQTTPAAAPPPPTLRATLLPQHEAVVPGGQTEIVVALELSAPWHLYHPIILDTGMPTEIRFIGPPQVRIDNLRLPSPTLDDLEGIEYLELSGRILALATLHAAPEARVGDALRISAHVSALACIEACVPVAASAELTLPVRAEHGPLANEPVVEEARAALTPTLGDAPHLDKSEITISAERLQVGQPAEIVARIRVREGLHVQDRDPGSEFLIGSRLLIESRNGLKIAKEAEQLWPTAKVREIPGFGSVREQSGEVVIRTGIQIVDEMFPSGPVELRALFHYQACTEQGQCFAPQFAAGLVRFVADTPNPPDERLALYRVRGPDDDVSAAISVASVTSGSDSPPATTAMALPLVLVFALLGGLILNVMPCVLPVISLKVLSFVQQGGEDPRRVLKLGLVFCAGIMVWFWLFAALSAFGQLPLQHAPVVVAISSVVFVFALNLFGIFEVLLPGSAAGKLDAIASREGYVGAFFKGFLATLLGTACTAPFLAAALVYAATQPLAISLIVFTAAGFGMAAPYLLLAANPAWMRFVPKPGMWMVTFKQASGFVLLGTAIWLLTIVADQLGASGVVWTVGFWSFLGLAAWIVGKIKPTWESGSRVAGWSAAAAVALAGGWFSFGVMYEPPKREIAQVSPESVVQFVHESDWTDGIPWTPYAPGLAPELAARGYSVYVDYTATWCVNCQVNKALVLETNAVRQRMRELGVIPIEADFTNQDPKMLAEIKKFGRPSVPLNLIYPAGKPDSPIVLDVLLTQSAVFAALEQAGPSVARASGVPTAP